MTLSVVIPVFNEEKVLPEFYRRLRDTVYGTSDLWEFIFVDDGSTDTSLEIIKQVASKDPRVTALSFTRNFGHQGGVIAGLRVSGPGRQWISVCPQSAPMLEPIAGCN